MPRNPIDLQRTCRVTGEEFFITPFEQEFCRKLEVPLPTVHPTERIRRLSAFSNYTNLFHGTCALTGEKTLQSYPPDSIFPVYSTPAWWSDEWNAFSYGRPYDFSRPFFAQIADLRDVVPQPALSVTTPTLENCDYINAASFCKNCYLIMHAYHSEDCCFCFGAFRCRDCVDCSGVYDSELCYDSTRIFNCYDLRHSFNCKNCRSSAFLWNCVGCSDCFACINLRNQRFCYWNTQLSESEYRAKMRAVSWDSFDEMERLRRDFAVEVRKHPQPSLRGVQIENCSGDFLSHSKNAHLCFDSSGLEDCYNCVRTEGSRDCMDMCAFGNNCELIYCSTRVGYDSSNIRLSALAYLSAADDEYCIFCAGCRHCFGCIGLRHAEYCILNRQYSRAEFFELRQRIITQMREHGRRDAALAYGEFFPYSISHMPLNASDAQLFLPISKEEALKRGANWRDEEDEEASADPSPTEFPERTRDVPETGLSGVFVCRTSGKPFRITQHELRIYRQREIPIPREHWKTRLLRREGLKNRPELYLQKCALTGREMLSTFPPDSGWTVYNYEDYLSSFAS